jgi:hypothetical protein
VLLLEAYQGSTARAANSMYWRLSDGLYHGVDVLMGQDPVANSVAAFALNFAE